MIDYCISLFKKEQEEKLFQNYIADGIKSISETLAGGNKTYLTMRYANIIDPPQKDNRTAEDIISNIKTKLKELGGEDD